MKVYIGPYKNWVGPYQISRILKYFGVSKKRCNLLGDWLADTPLSKICNWIDKKRNRNVKVRIDDYDVWNMDTTLSYIILPMLIKLKDQMQGSGWVEDCDVPEELRSDKAPKFDPDNEWDDLNSERWDWVINELIWTFEQIHPDNDWEDQFHSGITDFKFESIEGSENSLMVEGPDHTHKFDSEGHKKHFERISNGLRLFGRYYFNLWT